MKSQVLRESDRDDPALATGQWVSIAAWAAGPNYEVWINGKSVARGSAADPVGDPPPVAEIQLIGTGVVAGNAARLEVDYAAVWDLTPERPAPRVPSKE